MAIKTEIQSSKIIKPSFSTPPTLAHYKLGFTDELAPDENVGVVLFFSNISNHNKNFFEQLEKSLEKTLTRFYPFGGRYVEKTSTIDCNDHGVEFIYAKVSIKLQDYLVSEENVKYIDEFIPSEKGVVLQRNDPLLAAQVTTFECGGVAIGARVAHKIADASTLYTFINEWAVTNREREEIEMEFPGPHFNSSLLFPSRGLCSMPVSYMNNDELNKYTRISFSKSLISNFKAKGSSNTRRWSKVQLVSAILWKAFMAVDLATHNYQRESALLQPVNLREKMAPLIPRTSCGNMIGNCTTECKTLETIEELTNRLSEFVKKSVTSFLKERHDTEEGQNVVLKSILDVNNISESTCCIIVSSWCNFPFYEVDFGFGKPILAVPWVRPSNRVAILMDGVEGNEVEAYVCLQVKDIPHFEEALKNIFALEA